MNTNSFIRQMLDGGDCYINYISPVSKKPKYHIGTIDFRAATSPYIHAKFKATNLVNTARQKGHILVFCYDLDDIKVIDTSLVTSILPLNKVVRQPLDNQADTLVTYG